MMKLKEELKRKQLELEKEKDPPAGVPSITRTPGEATIEGNTVVLTCEIPRGNPLAIISWRCDGFTGDVSTSAIPPTNNTVSSIEKMLTKEDNNKECTCVGNHLFWMESKETKYTLIVYYPPSITISPTYAQYEVIENTTNLELDCKIVDSNPAVVSFRWYKDGAIIDGYTDASYTISTVRRSHTGIYTCAAINSVGTSDHASAVQLNVLFISDINPINKQEPTESTQLSVSCNAISYPEVKNNDVTWTKHNNATFIKKGQQLVIPNVQRIDSGTYICSVVLTLIPTIGQSVNYTRTTTVEVDVLYRPTVTVSPDLNTYKVIENSTNLQLTCKVIKANPAATSYRWYKDDFKISSTSIYTMLTVHRSHTGNYTCTATNIVGTSISSSVLQLIVLYGIEIDPISRNQPIEGTYLDIICSGQSHPEMEDTDITWTKNNNDGFIKKGRRLVINDVKRIDSATYVCSVVMTLTPTFGEPVNVSGTTHAEVDVLYRPTVTVSPDYNQYNMIENTTNLQFTCNVTDANPAVTSYTWYKGSSTISNADAYTIPTVLRSHTGSYTCDAANSVGSSIPSSAVQLNVLYGVDLNPIGKIQPHEGTKFIITCSGQSYPMMTSSDVKWFKQNNNTFAQIGLQLVIDNVNRLDSGIYACSVAIQLTPTIGQPVNVTGSTTVEVDVLYRPDVTVSPDINPYHVTENTTNVYLTCIIKDANPSVTSYTWYKNGVKVSTSAIYLISTVYRTHTGSYTCDATNVVGISDLTSEIHLDVLSGVSLKLSGTEVNINESERWNLTCVGDGNPLPKINWIYNNNSTIVGEQKSNVIYINVQHANCVDTGLYMCSGNNSIGEPVSQSADIKVACKPRTYNNLDRVDIIMRATDESINISTTFISLPLPHISWSRELSGGHLADLDSNFKYFTIPSHLPYETIAILQKDQLKPNEFGFYLVNASNTHGSFVMKYNFIQKRDPILPSYVYVVCKSTTAIVILKPIVNENMPQDLYIQYAVEGKDMTSIKVHTNDASQSIEYTVTGLNPGRKYNFSILAVNPFGETRSNQFECLTETLSYREDMLAVKEGNGGMFSAGIASIVVGLLFFVAATIFIFRKRFRKTYTKSSKSDEYSDLQTSNPAFQDPYTSLQNPIESINHQEPSANTYEECGNADAAAYQNIENMKSGHKKAEKNMGIYDNMKI